MAVTKSTNRRKSPPRRKRDTVLLIEVQTVNADIAACADRVAQLERTLKTLRGQVERLHKKMRA